MPSSATERFIKIVSHLGGPSIAPSDIEWTTDLPAGKQLIEWIASQLDDDDDVEQGIIESDHQDILGACLRDISLEPEEISLLQSAGPLNLLGPAAPKSEDILHYSRPSEIRVRTELINSNSELLEEQCTRTKHQIYQTRIATQKASSSLQSLQSKIASMNEHIKDHEEALHELSLSADSEVTASTAEALRLILTSGHAITHDTKTPQKKRPQDNYPIASLAALARLRSHIVHRTECSINSIDNLEASLLGRDELSLEAARLHAAFHAPKTGLLHISYEAAYQEELLRFIHDIEESGVPESRIHGEGEPSVELNVGLELERAWFNDHRAILLTRGKVLEQAISAFKDTLMFPLLSLYNSLSSMDANIQETLALTSALDGELEYLVTEIQDARGKHTEDAARANDVQDDITLETRLINVLKEHSDERPNTAPPLVLLDRGDLMRELRYQATRANEAEDRLLQWTAAVTESLLSATGNWHRLQSLVYANSPINTSLPFASEPSLTSLRLKIVERSDAIQQTIAHLKRDSQMSSRSMRKAGVFVQKYS